MRIIDTYSSIFTAFKDDSFDMRLWQSYAENAYPGLIKKIQNDYSGRISDKFDFDKKILPILNGVIKKSNLSEKAHNAFTEVTNDLSVKVNSKFKTDLDVDIILYLGLGNAAGWATSINNKKVILLGLEKIVELDWCSKENMIALIFHELGHIWHFEYEKKKLLYSSKERAIQQMYREGVAMVFEQTLCEDDCFFHQDQNGWLEWCEANDALIKREYVKRLKSRESVQDFFGDWCSFMNHSDVGYYLGAAFVRFLMKDCTLEEIAKMKIRDVCKQFYKFAQITE